MKITRRQLRSLITEADLSAEELEAMSDEEFLTSVKADLGEKALAKVKNLEKAFKPVEKAVTSLAYFLGDRSVEEVGNSTGISGAIDLKLLEKMLEDYRGIGSFSQLSAEAFNIARDLDNPAEKPVKNPFTPGRRDPFEYRDFDD